MRWFTEAKSGDNLKAPEIKGWEGFGGSFDEN
jgi:hypothetical protein